MFRKLAEKKRDAKYTTLASDILEKCKAVAGSCETWEQAAVAEMYCHRAYEYLVRHLRMSFDHPAVKDLRCSDFLFDAYLNVSELDEKDS